MADEVTEQIETPNETPEVVQPSEAETRAMEQGWVPKDKWEGSGKWRDAEEFLDRGELFEKIDKLTRKVHNQDQLLVDLKKHHKAVKETEFRRAIDQLNAAKVQALDDSNNKLVVEIDDKISQVKQAQAIAAQEQVVINDPPAPAPALVIWMNRNPWYEKDQAMKIYADVEAQRLYSAGMRDPIQVLEEVEKRVKKEFTHKFNNPNRSKPGTVDGEGSKGSTQSKEFVLNDEERRVMNRFVKAGVMTEKEYIAEIKATKGN